MSNYSSVTIASGGVNSSEIMCDNTSIIAIAIPSAMTNTSVKVQAKFFEADDWEDLYYNGVLVSVPATVSTKQKFVPGSMVGLYKVRLVATGVGNEAADRVIQFVTEGLL